MKYVCIDTAEYLYPDIATYKSGTDKMNILTPRGTYACGQVFLYEGYGNVKVSCQGWEPEMYEMLAIPVESNPLMKEDTWAPHTPERKAPFEVYDCLKPYNGKLTFKNGVCAVYFSLWIPQDAPVGMISGSIQIGEISVPVCIEVASAVIPSQESLDVYMCLSAKSIMEYHKVEAISSEYDALETAYLKLLRRMHQNTVWLPFLPKVTVLQDEAETHYRFDFSEAERFLRKAFRMGFQKFSMAIGFRESWDKSTIFLFYGVSDIPSMSAEGYYFLAEYIPALYGFLEERGWADRLLLSISDEPNDVNATEYRALCGLVRKFAPKIKLCDAMSYGLANGAVDIDIVLSEEYVRHQKEFERLRRSGDELWYYDALIPRGSGCINRFMDYALLATRYHGWANYAYDFKGYLHWAANYYQPGQDPFTESCPNHNNAGLKNVLPAGDTHIMYPGESGPWMSVRLESYREGFEEFELLHTLAMKDKEKADALCAKVFRTFYDVEYDPLVFGSVRDELIRSLV